uniref:Terminase large subunit GpA endonuclease domain-containing protein n=1 Tax=Arsenophonus endosymbiont of Trialeurodes vaporariorum TaxID=235567 RepID=A0A3B0M177_9GAMM
MWGPDTPYGIKWDKDAEGNGLAHTTYYVCSHHGCVIRDSDKPLMIKKGQWRSERPFNGHAGFHIWAGYSLFPNALWPNLVKEWLRVKDDSLMRQTLINLVLNKPYEDRGEKALNEKKLLACCEVWVAEVPEGVAVLTAGVDTQDGRFEIEVIGWGKMKKAGRLLLM